MPAVMNFLNRACGRANDFFSKNADLQPTVELNRRYPLIADKIVEQLEQAAQHGVVYVDPSIKTLKEGEKALPPELKKFLETEYPSRGYIDGSTQRKTLVSYVQSRLTGPDEQPLKMDDRIGIVTARELLKRLRNEGDAEPAPCL